jgi:hypothetical protein
MNISEMMDEHRQKEIIAICSFINHANLYELAMIIEEIRCCHDNILAFNFDTALLAKIESVSINGECIQLNIEREEMEEDDEGDMEIEEGND